GADRLERRPRRAPPPPRETRSSQGSAPEPRRRWPTPVGDPGSGDREREEPVMTQQGQVLKLKTNGADGKPLWAYRYRLDGRGSTRPQVGGFGSQGEAMQALNIPLERLRRRSGRLGQITLSELVAEYLAQHEAAPRTNAKLRWLLAKATDRFGERRVVDLRSDEIGSWRATLPEGHRFEATQAL